MLVSFNCLLDTTQNIWEENLNEGFPGLTCGVSVKDCLDY